MKKSHRLRAVTYVATFAMLFSLCAGIMVTDNASAKSNGGGSSRKVSADLGGKASGELVRVVLQLGGKPGGQLNALLNRGGVHVRAHFQNLNSYAVELPAGVVDELAAFDEVSYVSLDRETQPLGHLTATSGTDNVREQKSTTLLGGTTTTILDGTGVGIAVLDSGVDTRHTAFLDKSNGVRVVKSVDFTGENRTDDPYGHGTHVAALAAGNGRISNGAYTGIAPNAGIVNLRVLNSQGKGTVSGVLAALNWLAANRAAYNVRVVNMSLGMPAVTPTRTTPYARPSARSWTRASS